jgi:RNA polymerase sigma-70 factor (ECF subfamily)
VLSGVTDAMIDRSTESPARRNSDDVATDVALRDSLLGGHHATWQAFLETHGRLVRATIGRVVRRFGITGGSEDARDIEATFWVELLANDKAKLRAFSADRGVRFSTWIAMLASHAAYDFLRRRRREPSGDEPDATALVSDAPDPHALCELHERARLVETALLDFTRKDRAFIELYLADELEPAQIAEQLGISVKTVYSKRHKIQYRLESLLSQHRAAA